MLQITQGYVIVDTVNSIVQHKTFRTNRGDSWRAFGPECNKPQWLRLGFRCVPMEGRLAYQVFKKQQ